MDKVAVSRAVAKLVGIPARCRACGSQTRGSGFSRLRHKGESVHARIAPIALASEKPLSTLNNDRRKTVGRVAR